MSNKSQLALNNTNLQSILSTVLGLPTQESVKHGKYVWKKYEYTPSVTVENPSITVTHGGSIVNFPITDANFDLTKVSDYERFFDGFIGGTTYPNISYETSTSKLYFKENGAFQPTIDSFVADSETTGRFVVSSTTSVTPTSTTFSYSGTKELSEASIGAFVDFFVSDQETAYPDGGTQDGYWYDKVVEGMQLELFGCTKMAIDEFTPTSDVYDYKTILNHSFGEIPKKAFILPKNDFTHPGNSKSYVKFGFLDYTDVYKTIMHYLYILLKKDQTYSSSSYAELTGGSYSPTDKTLVFPSANYFMAGVTYQIITMG